MKQGLSITGNTESASVRNLWYLVLWSGKYFFFTKVSYKCVFNWVIINQQYPNKPTIP